MMHFHHKTNKATPYSHKTPALDYWNTIFVDPFPGHQNCKLSQPDLCSGKEKKTFKEFLLYDLYGYILAQEALSRGSCTGYFTILVVIPICT